MSWSRALGVGGFWGRGGAVGLAGELGGGGFWGFWGRGGRGGFGGEGWHGEAKDGGHLRLEAKWLWILVGTSQKWTSIPK